MDLDKYNKNIDVSDHFIELDYESNEDLGIVGAGPKEKTAGFELPNNVQEWNHKVLKKFHNDYDWIDADGVYIRWRSKFDSDDGFGIGILILEMEGRKASVPIIVKDYELQPMDIYYDNQKEVLKPFTEMNLQKTFFSTDRAEEVGTANTSNHSGRNLMKDVFAPRMGKYTFASADYDLVDHLEVTEEQLADFNSAIKDKEVLAHANKNKNFMKLAKKILSKTPTQDDKPNKTKISSAIVKENNPKGYEITYLENDDVKIKTASYYDAFNFIKDEFGIAKEAFDRNIDTDSVTAFSRNNVAAGLEDDPIDYEPITESGVYDVMLPNGQTITGYAIPITLDLREGHKVPDVTILDKNRNILTSKPNIVGLETRGKKSIHDIVRDRINRIPSRGDIVSFVWHSNNHGDYVITEPAKVLDFEELSGQGRLYTLFNGLGQRFKILEMKNLVKADFSRDNKYDAILIPEESALAVLTEEHMNVLNKTSSVKKNILKDAAKIDIDYFKDTNEFKLSGAIKKEASPKETLLELASKGIDFETAKKALKKEASIYFLEESLEKQASPDVGVDFEYEPPKDLLKIASKVKDIKTLDELLSLNFVNKDNLGLLYKKVPEFKETVQQLAALALTARIGNIGVEETTITRAMKALQTLIEKMEGYQFEGV